MIAQLVFALATVAPPVSDTLRPPPAAPGAAGLVAVHSQPAIPLVALRVSLVADDPPGYAGAGHFQQHLVFPQMQEGAARVGGEAQVLRTADALVYSVVGPAVELTYLARLLRSALTLPTAGEGAMLAASGALLEERNAEWETASGLVRARLRSRLFPDDLPAAGTPASASRLNHAALAEAWSAMYRPERVAVVAVGNVDRRTVRDLFASLPSAGEDLANARLRDTIDSAPPLPAQATRGWLGAGVRTSVDDAAAATVTARLLRSALGDALPAAEVHAEQWWTHRGAALVIVVGTPAAQLSAGRQALTEAPAALQRAISDDRVRAAAESVRRDLRFAARTPEGMAALIGQWVDRDGDAAGVQRFHEALGRVGVEDVHRILDQLRSDAVVRTEVPPQALRRRS